MSHKTIRLIAKGCPRSFRQTELRRREPDAITNRTEPPARVDGSFWYAHRVPHDHLERS
jgi:hypothetical protein